MKVGDTFKHKSTGNEYKILQKGFRSEITLLDTARDRLFDANTVKVGDVTNITKEEFLRFISHWNIDVYSYLDGSPLFPAPTYNIGDRFVMTKSGSEFWTASGTEEFMITHICDNIALVSLCTGNYWSDVIDFPKGAVITEEQFYKIAGGATFKKVKA